MSIQAITCAMALRDVTPSEKLLLLALANYADEHMRCYPSQRRLAEDTCLSDRTIRTLLAGLEGRRMLTRQERQRSDGSRSTDVVTLHFAGQVATSISGGAEMVSGGVGKPLPGGGEMASALTTFEPSPEPIDDADKAHAPDWNKRLDEAKAAGGEGLNLTIPAMHVFRDLRELCEPATGDPCEWGEVLDAVKVVAAKAHAAGKPVRSWTWVRDTALGFRDRRLVGLPAPNAATGSTGPPVSGSYTAQRGAENEEARRKAYALMDAENG